MEKNPAMKVSFVSIIVNVILSILKFLAGIFAHSSALISDAVHSFSDVASTVIVIIGIKLSSKSADKEHPYGHERMECIAAVILAVALALTGVGIGYKGLMIIHNHEYENMIIPGTAALVAAALSIIVKEWMYWYTRNTAKKINSNALMADAWHHRSDAMSSVGSFIGIFAARIGFPIFESAASVVICLFIIKTAVDIITDSFDRLVDKSCGDETEKKISDIILAQDGVIVLEDLKTRMFGSKIYVDIIIAVDGEIKLSAAHDIAESVHDAIENEMEEVKHCMVHVNPYENDTP